ncbi:hypothetical protein M408DRAFT_29835 [Serendipita vermifera MAFF 305830]|uniref:Uncharacterized protein n=1 Tax=Serendipita vermifera MAFF 305830 TaxID=933852 RepID=A0A0C2W3L9_SERVB|nr:hypothetical protein M408DRAFT_29835 [Serendipita vermifera MAFF 305830]
MANISPIDAFNLATLSKSIEPLAEVKRIINGYKEEDEKLAESQTQLRQQLHKVDSQRERLRLEMISAELSKRIIQTTTENLRSLCPPIRYLPTEILLYIFQLLVVKGHNIRTRGRKSWNSIAFDRSPIVISQVCSRWRVLAHQCPDLWTSILLNMHIWRSSEPTKISREELRVAMWKFRGKQKTQSVLIDWWGPEDSVDHIKKALGSNPEPWKAISINLFKSSRVGEWDTSAVCADEVAVYQYELPQNLTYFMPLLRRATSITIYGPMTWGSARWSLLQSLSIRSFLVRPTDSFNTLGFSSLEFRELLQATPALVRLELDFAAVRVGPGQGVHEVQHSSLRYLALRMSHFENGPGPFGVRLVAPSFEALRIFSIITSANWVTPIISMEYIKKLSLCSLNQTTIWNALALIRQLPNLEVVELEGAHANTILRTFNSTYRPPISRGDPLQFSKVARLLMSGTDIRGVTLIEHLELRLWSIETGVAGVWPVTEVNLYENEGVTPGEWTQISVLLDRGRQLIAT